MFPVPVGVGDGISDVWVAQGVSVSGPPEGFAQPEETTKMTRRARIRNLLVMTEGELSAKLMNICPKHTPEYCEQTPPRHSHVYINFGPGKRRKNQCKKGIFHILPLQSCLLPPRIGNNFSGFYDQRGNPAVRHDEGAHTPGKHPLHLALPDRSDDYEISPNI